MALDAKRAVERFNAHVAVTGIRANTPKKALDSKAALSLVIGKGRPRPETETARIAALPTWSPAEFAGLDLTREFRAPGGTMTLRPIQSLALYWMRKAGGLLGPIGVGHGKGLLTMLAGKAMNAARPVLFLPPNMREPFARELRKFRAHYAIPTNLRVVAYSQLSVASGAELLTKLNPDLVIADEVHHLRHPTSTRTKRVLRYFSQFPNTRFVGLSGTVTRKGLKDYAHLTELALGSGSPLPLEAFDLLAWANCIDADGEATDTDWHTFGSGGFFLPPEWEEWSEDERRAAARASFQRRLVTTPGIVATDTASVGASLAFVERPIRVPVEVERAIREVDASWCRPDGEEMDSPLAKYRLDAQLSSGFYYRWVWPNGVEDTEWMEARAGWHRAVRAILKHNRPKLDSPLLVARATIDGHLPEIEATYATWAGQKHKPAPPTETVWLSSFVVDDAVVWALERIEAGQPGIIWYADNAIATALHAAGIPTYTAGMSVPTSNEDAFVFAASIRAFGTGQNLQAWATNLVLSFPTSGSDAEQLIGRTHRAGQLEDEVEVHYYAHTKQAREALRKSRSSARYIEATTGDAQRLCYGTWYNPTWKEDSSDG